MTTTITGGTKYKLGVLDHFTTWSILGILIDRFQSFLQNKYIQTLVETLSLLDTSMFCQSAFKLPCLKQVVI